MEITLAIYDLLGRKVRLVIEWNILGGSHSIVWDGRNEQGHTE
jgi:hypothetical protein